MKSFGKSAPIKDLYKHFNLTSDNIVEIAKKKLGR
jgi:transketolase